MVMLVSFKIPNGHEDKILDQLLAELGILKEKLNIFQIFNFERLTFNITFN